MAYAPTMTSMKEMAFRTSRLIVRPALSDDAGLIHSLWSDPRVTTFVGFPGGIPTPEIEIRAQIERDRERPLKRLLIAERADDGEPIGEIKLGEPNGDGISEPDIKLFPEHWAQGYGRELWGAMIDHLFEQDACRIVQGTPNVANVGSIRMMERCGMSRVGEGRFVPGGPLRDSMTDVPHYVYQITREEWQETRQEIRREDR